MPNATSSVCRGKAVTKDSATTGLERSAHGHASTADLHGLGDPSYGLTWGMGLASGAPIASCEGRNLLRCPPPPHVRHFASMFRRSACQGHCKGNKQLGCDEDLLKGFVERLPLLLGGFWPKRGHGTGQVCRITPHVDQHVSHGPQSIKEKSTDRQLGTPERRRIFTRCLDLGFPAAGNQLEPGLRWSPT